MKLWARDDDLLLRCDPEKRPLVQTVLSAYDSIEGDVAYVSTPITTGKLLFAAMRKYRVTDPSQLPREVLFEEVIKPNILLGLDAAKRIGQLTSLPLVVPASFEAKGQKWSQNEYMCLWLTLIDSKVREIYFRDGWQYSSGCVEEFIRAKRIYYGIGFDPAVTLNQDLYDRLRGIKICDERGHILTLERAYDMVAVAVLDVAHKGFGADSLKRKLDHIQSLAFQQMYQGFGFGGREYTDLEDRAIVARQSRLGEKHSYVDSRLGLLRAA